MMLTFNYLAKGWNRFFYQERPTYNLAIFRILWGALVFVNILFELGNVEDFYGPQGIVSWEVVKNHYPEFQLSLFKIVNNTSANAWGIYILTLVSLFLVTIGWQTRVALFGALIGIVSLHMRNVWILSSADVLIRCIFVILVWSPCFNVLSVDSYLARRKGRPLPITGSQWTWRLIQIQVSVVYLWTFWAKIKGDTWFDGSAVYYATRLDTMKNMTLPWLLDNRLLIKLSTWGTLFIEFALGSLVWFKGFRTPVVIGGILLHLGIEVAMAIPFFEWMMIFLLMSFYNPEEYFQLYKWSYHKMKKQIIPLLNKEGELL
ncbi:MAG TPA: HTTM domain-containing protein [Bacteriovoracaceae bacterium]|nr:HTTM domain-containing protein [Bacteriovoracaceae bacterium]HLW57633.1 HTTM domain-containing protein [Bacteriovoracaceae bacterium]